MIKTAFSTLSCPDWTWREMIDKGKQFCFDGVEIRLVNRELDLLKVPEFRPSELPQRRRELADSEFRVCGLASSVRFHDAEKTDRDLQIETGKKYVDLAVELETDFVRVFGDIVPEGIDRETIIEQVSEGLNRLGEYAATVDKKIVIESHGDFSDSILMQETISRVENPTVGVLWDTHHPWRYFDESIVDSFNRLNPRILHTHWKDSISQSRFAVDEQVEQSANEAHALMGGHRHADYVLFGGGEFPALECMRLLKQANYDGWFSLEWEKMWHPEIESPEVALPLFPGKIQALWDLCE